MQSPQAVCRGRISPLSCRLIPLSSLPVSRKVLLGQHLNAADKRRLARGVVIHLNAIGASQTLRWAKVLGRRSRSFGNVPPASASHPAMTTKTLGARLSGWNVWRRMCWNVLRPRGARPAAALKSAANDRDGRRLKTGLDPPRGLAGRGARQQRGSHQKRAPALVRYMPTRDTRLHRRGAACGATCGEPQHLFDESRAQPSGRAHSA